MTAQTTSKTAELFEVDYVAWLERQAELLRSRRLTEIDAERLAEELEAMTASQRRELISRLTVLLAHLLKRDHQPSRRNRSWDRTIAEQRRELRLLLEESPSLRRLVPLALERAYPDARKEAAVDTQLTLRTFPTTLPYSLAELIGE